MKIVRFIVLLIIFCSLSTFVNAALVDNSDGTITQTRNDGSVLMWMQDANLAATNTFGVSSINSNGTMALSTANDWISALNTANYLGYDDWRLPDINPVNGISYNFTTSFDGSTDLGYNISAPGSAYPGSTGSEMAYMYYSELGNTGWYYLNGNGTGACYNPPYCLTETNSFVNMQTAYAYWSGTDSPIPDADLYFNFGGGYQYDHNIDHIGYAWAVRTVVPEPISSILFITGGTLLAGRRFIRRKA